MTKPPGYYGQQGLTDANGPYNANQFQIEQAIKRIRTAIPVRVVGVSGGGVGAAATVSVFPLINQTDGVGNQTPHTTVFNVPCLRNQGGGNAFINDPVIGDVGYMLVSDRDMSAVKGAQGGQANPGSRRHHSMADGVYLGAMLNPGNPDQSIQFTATGIRIADKNGNVIVMDAGAITITGDLRVSGSITAGYGGGDAVTLQTHTHAGGPPPDPGS